MARELELRFDNASKHRCAHRPRVIGTYGPAASTLPRVRLHEPPAHPRIESPEGRCAGEGGQRAARQSSPAFTMTAYQHLVPGMQADAAGMVSANVFGA